MSGAPFLDCAFMRFPKNRIDELKESVRKGNTRADQGSRDPTLANTARDRGPQQLDFVAGVRDGAPEFLKFETETHEEAGPPVRHALFDSFKQKG
jgi:hypothetical protein